MNLCKYKNMFGAPNTGAHKYRFLNIAIVDVLATVIVAYILSWIFKTNFFWTQTYVSVFKRQQTNSNKAT